MSVTTPIPDSPGYSATHKTLAIEYTTLNLPQKIQLDALYAATLPD